MLYDLAAGLGLAAGAAVLDVGCGAGRHSIQLAHRLGLTVLGVDPDPRSIGIARQALDRAFQEYPGLGQLVSFAPGTAQHLPAADHSIDLVWCRDVLCLVEQIGPVYAEFRRVLRPGGRAVGRDLLHAARLIRDPARYVSQFGQGNYDIALADCLWHIYRMIGKLSGRIYLLTAP